MIVPHRSDNFTQDHEKHEGLSLVPQNQPLRLINPLPLPAGEENRIKQLQSKIRELQEELSSLHASLAHKDQLLRNFRTREMELKTELLNGRIE